MHSKLKRILHKVTRVVEATLVDDYTVRKVDGSWWFGSHRDFIKEGLSPYELKVLCIRHEHVVYDGLTLNSHEAQTLISTNVYRQILPMCKEAFTGFRWRHVNKQAALAYAMYVSWYLQVDLPEGLDDLIPLRDTAELRVKLEDWFKSLYLEGYDEILEGLALNG